MKFNYQHSFYSPIQNSPPVKTVLNYLKKLKQSLLKSDYSLPECSINLPTDQKVVAVVEEMRQKKIISPLKYFINIGIGGSNLGAKAVYDALFGFYDLVEPDRFPKMLFLDTNDSRFLTKTVTILNRLPSKKDFLINIISKSGSTTETVVNAEIIFNKLKKTVGGVFSRVVVTTQTNSPLFTYALQKNLAVLPQEKQVGGRYSLFSAVGMFPLLCVGVDINALRKGASKIRVDCLNEDVTRNPAALSALIIAFHYFRKKNIHDTFFFHPALESLGKWYRQLMGESVGKEQDLGGNIVRRGITPTVSIGTTDLHSVAQLYLGGPKDKLTTFVGVEIYNAPLKLPNKLQLPLVENLENRSIEEIMQAIYHGVKLAYQKQLLPFIEVVLPKINESTLGEFLQFKMIEMMFLAQILHVNAFDQPHVELYKIETKKYLKSKQFPA